MPVKPHPTDPDKMVYVKAEYNLGEEHMIQAKEIDGELWIKAADFHKAIKDAQRPWVDLTDEDINTLYWNREPFKRPTLIQLANEIITKFKEKNNA